MVRLQAVRQVDPRLPAELLPRQADIRLALPGVIRRQRLVDEFRARTGHFPNRLRQFEHGEFTRVAEIDRAGAVRGAVHQPDKTLDQIIDIAE
jgi:hypothetical protein